MPTYVYECPKCKAQTEIIAKITETRIAPVCVESGCDGQQTMSQILFPVGVSFRGSGWTPRYHNK